ncbi:MAG: hypothetical protein H8E20_11265 [Verrucomicrobia bacterium]|nr:hypothetical protein [Verrucomicrobiota bacterium]
MARSKEKAGDPTLIRPAATFSLREKESNRTCLAKLTLSQRERVGERENANNNDELFF